VSEQRSPAIFNQRLHDLLVVLAQQPEDAKIRVTAGTIAYLMNTGRHSSEHLRALWGAAGFPKTLTGKEAKQLLAQVEEVKRKQLEENSRKHYVQVGPSFKQTPRAR